MSTLLPLNWFHYEFLNGRLLGSEHPENLESEASQKLEVMRRISEHLVVERAVGAVVNLTHDACVYGVENLAAYHCPLNDTLIDQIDNETIDEVVGIIERHILLQQGVWIHCQAGIDRTG